MNPTQPIGRIQRQSSHHGGHRGSRSFFSVLSVRSVVDFFFAPGEEPGNQ
jgi:hypothetical protein